MLVVDRQHRREPAGGVRGVERLDLLERRLGHDLAGRVTGLVAQLARKAAAASPAGAHGRTVVGGRPARTDLPMVHLGGRRWDCRYRSLRRYTSALPSSG